jgi:2-methylcitrate dehydratase PrpD
MKPWPCCRHVHPAVDAALEVHDALNGEEPVSVEIATYQAALDVCDRPQPDTLYAAKFSLQHCVNAALRNGRVDFDSFDDSHRSRLAGASRSTSLAVSKEFDQAYPARWGAAVSATTAAGKTVSAARADCRGDPEAPLSSDEIVAKAQMVMRRGGIEDAALIEKILAMPNAAQLPGFPSLGTIAAAGR